MRTLLSFLPVLIAITAVTACVHKPTTPVSPPDGNYPTAIANIIINKCAIAGCHNRASYQNSDGLLMDTWDHLFDGGNNGAVVVAYSPAYSSLLYFVNTDSSLGIVAAPHMPLSTTINTQSSLTREEYMTLRNWIAAGAPDKNGNIPFASNADTRQKIYLTSQGCDLLAVIDAKRRVVMRYTPIGADSLNIESPHDVEVSSDGRYAYVPFYNGRYVLKIDTRTDAIVGSVNVGNVALGGLGLWSIISLSPQDTALMVSGMSSPGYIVTVNTTTMHINENLSIDQVTGGTASFPYPHGLAANVSFDTFYATLQYGNNIIKYAFNTTGGLSYSKLINVAPAGSAPDPHQLEISPDGTKYFVTCQQTAELRAFAAHTDSLLAVIPVGTEPQEMAVSVPRHYLFVSCMEDAANPLPGRRGSVYVIDNNSLQVVTVLYGDFYQPHDIAVDEQDTLLFIASRNANPGGPAPHHATGCGGRAGWYSVYNLNTLQPADNKRYEVTVDPYAIAPRF
jgi:DNA-binding beta-propeller fold protein YncE